MRLKDEVHIDRFCIPDRLHRLVHRINVSENLCRRYIAGRLPILASCLSLKKASRAK